MKGWVLSETGQTILGGLAGIFAGVVIALVVCWLWYRKR